MTKEQLIKKFRSAAMRGSLLVLLLGGYLLHAAAAMAAPLPSPANDTLWLTLAGADSLAIKHNAEVRAGESRLVASQADIVGAGLYPNPNLSFNATYIDLFKNPVDYSNSQNSLRLDQTILLGGKIGSKKESAEHAYSAAQTDYAGYLFQLNRDVKDNAIDLAYAEKQVEVARASYNLFVSLDTVSQTRLKAGDISQQDLDKIQLTELNIRQALSDAEASLADALSQMHQTLGLQPDQPIVIQYDLAPVLKDIVPDTVLAIGLRTRYDIRSAEERLLSVKSSIDVAHANAIPDLDIGVEWDKQGPDFRSLFGGGIGIAIPIFNRNQDDIQRTEANYEAGTFDLEAATNGAKNEINGAITKYVNTLGIMKKFSDLILATANRVRDNEVKNYSTGNIGLLDLLQTQQLYTGAMNDYYTALYRLAKNQVALERAVGTEIF